MNAGIIIFVVLLVLAFLGLPIYLSIGIATLVAMLQAGFPLEAIAQKTFLGMNSASLLCIPLFIYAGYLFGGLDIVQRNLKLLIVAIIVLSVLPAVIEVWRARRGRRKTK